MCVVHCSHGYSPKSRKVILQGTLNTATIPARAVLSLFLGGTGLLREFQKKKNQNWTNANLMLWLENRANRTVCWIAYTVCKTSVYRTNQRDNY